MAAEEAWGVESEDEGCRGAKAEVDEVEELFAMTGAPGGVGVGVEVRADSPAIRRLT